jgi:hypothetical protein
MKSRLLPGAAFILSLAAGKLLMSSVAVPERDSAQTQPVALSAGKRDQASGSASAAVERPAAPSILAESLGWERKMWQMDIADFPAAFEEECRTAVEDEQVYRLMQIWQERDLESFLVWGRNQPDIKALPGTGFNIEVRSEVISAACLKSPGFAWKLAKDLTSNIMQADRNRGAVIGFLLRSDPNTARDFVRQHVDEIQAFNQSNLGWYGVDPQKALPVAMEIPPGAVRSSILKELARYYGEKADKIGEAKTWFQSLPTENQEKMRKMVNEENPFYGISETHKIRLREAWK